MNVLVVGGGGREHAIVWKLNQSPKVNKIYCAPGNGGISEIAECVNIDAVDVKGMVDFAKKNPIDFVVVAPDDPLALGMVDALEKENIPAFGPDQQAAKLESSKVFAKQLMKKYHIPTAEYEMFQDMESALSHIQDCSMPVVIKADGLALGKGVFIVQNKQEAQQAIVSIMRDKAFGKAGNQIVIEEYMEGTEATVLAFTDGKTITPMVSSQDHKRAYDNDQGPNTGGMGAFSPSPLMDDEMEALCMEKIYQPTLEALCNEGIVYKGVLYFGLMITEEGPKVVEYNARFGDPEAQVILPRLKTDLMEIFQSVVAQKLDQISIEWEDCGTACIMLASGGYPKNYQKGYEILGLDQTKATVFHSGTKKTDDKFHTNGGRVLGIMEKASTYQEAVKKAYQAIEAGIFFKDMHYRKDIGKS